MRKTTFWRKAFASLPARVQPRYRADFEQMERWELALDGAIEALKTYGSTQKFPFGDAERQR